MDLDSSLHGFLFLTVLRTSVAKPGLILVSSLQGLGLFLLTELVGYIRLDSSLQGLGLFLLTELVGYIRLDSSLQGLGLSSLTELVGYVRLDSSGISGRTFILFNFKYNLKEKYLPQT